MYQEFAFDCDSACTNGNPASRVQTGVVSDFNDAGPYPGLRNRLWLIHVTADFRAESSLHFVLSVCEIATHPVRMNWCVRLYVAASGGVLITVGECERSLRAFQRRTPFRSITVALANRDLFDVDHAEAFVFPDRVAVFIAAGECRLSSITAASVRWRLANRVTIRSPDGRWSGGGKLPTGDPVEKREISAR